MVGFTVFDLVRGLGRLVGNLSIIKPINKKYKKWLVRNQVGLNKIDHYARYFKYIFLLWIFQAAFLGIGTIKKDGEHGIVSVIYLLFVFLVLGLFNERSWCKYVCPVGGVMGIFAKYSPTRIARNKDACIGCNICSKTCPMNIDVANTRFVQEFDCQTCLQCVEACPVDDTLNLKIKTPRFSKKKNLEILQKESPS